MADVTVHDRSGLLLSSSPVPTDEDINQAELVGIVEATELVYIHPFANGNGRWGRLMTNVLAARELRLSPITWAEGAGDLRDPESEERKTYVAAIKAADEGDFMPLMTYLKALNAELK